MKISEYIIDIDKIIDLIKNNGYKTIALQLPEGLKSSALQIVDLINKKIECNIIIIADPCYGACDIANYELKNLGVEFLIQIGHTSIPELNNNFIPTKIINALSSIEVSKIVKKSISELEGKRIGILTTAQHLHTLETVKKILNEKNFITYIPKGDKRIYDKGQILGCNFSSAVNISDKVDSFLFVGSGTFHPIGLLLRVKKPVIAADPFSNTVKKQELIELKDKILRQRYGAINKSKNAENFGILIGIKKGQQRMKLAYNIRDMLKLLEKKVFFIALDNFASIHLQNFRDVDCFISTSCPRIAIDDFFLYKKPIITSIELEIVIGKRKWEDYIFDEITSY